MSINTTTVTLLLILYIFMIGREAMCHRHTQQRGLSIRRDLPTETKKVSDNTCLPIHIVSSPLMYIILSICH